MIDTLFSASIKTNNVSYLEKFPNALLGERDKEARKWIVDYYHEFGIMPTKERFTESDYSDYFTSHLISSPLDDLYNLTLDAMKERFVQSRLRQFEIDMEKGDLSASSIISLGNELSLFNKSDVIILNDYNRDELYSPHKTGINFGLGIIDDSTGGIQPGELAVIAARPETGKTLLSMFIAWNVVTNYGKDLEPNSTADENSGKKVLFLSGEMVKAQIIARMDGIAGRFNPKILRTKHDLDRLATAKLKAIDGWQKVRGQFITPERLITSPEKMLELINQYEPDLVIFDAPYRMSKYTKGGSDWRADRQVVLDLADITKTNNVRTIITTQISRGSISGSYDLGDLSFSDAYGQEADIVLGLWNVPARPTSIVTSILKSRNGSKLGAVQYTPDFSVMELREESYEAE